MTYLSTTLCNNVSISFTLKWHNNKIPFKLIYDIKYLYTAVNFVYIDEKAAGKMTKPAKTDCKHHAEFKSLRLQEMRQIFGQTLFPKITFLTQNQNSKTYNFQSHKNLGMLTGLPPSSPKRALQALGEWQTSSCTENTLQCSELYTINNNLVKSAKSPRITLYKI